MDNKDEARMNHPIYDHDRYLTDTECADVRAGRVHINPYLADTEICVGERVRSFNSSAQHWIIVGACLGILAGVAVVAVALRIGGLI